MHSIYRLGLFLFMGGLTLAASGDDVCLLRLLTSSLPTNLFLLDDPNTDFTDANASSTKITVPAPQFILSSPSLLTSDGVLSFLRGTPDADLSIGHDLLTPFLRC